MSANVKTWTGRVVYLLAPLLVLPYLAMAVLNPRLLAGGVVFAASALLFLLFLGLRHRYALILGLAAKGFADCFWFLDTPLGENFKVNPNMLLGTFVPVAVALTGLPRVLTAGSIKLRDVFVILTILFAMAVTLWTADMGLAVRESLKVATSLLLLIFIGVFVERRDDLEWILFALLGMALAVLPVTGYTIVRGTGYHVSHGGYIVLTGPFHDKHGMAAFLTIGLLSALGLLTYYRGRPHRFIFLALAIVFGLGIAVTNSRATWIAVFLYVVLWAVRHRRWVIVTALLVGTVLVAPVVQQRFAQAGLDVRDPDSIHLDGRVYIWDRVWDRYTSATLPEKLFGLGYGSTDVDVMSANMLLRYNAHNLWLMMLVETGIVGLLLFHAALAGFVVCLLSDISAYPEWGYTGRVFREVTIGLCLFYCAAGVTGHPHKFPFNSWPCYITLSAYAAAVFAARGRTRRALEADAGMSLAVAIRNGSSYPTA